jgi:hypothetical protein
MSNSSHGIPCALQRLTLRPRSASAIDCVYPSRSLGLLDTVKVDTACVANHRFTGDCYTTESGTLDPQSNGNLEDQCSS